MNAAYEQNACMAFPLASLRETHRSPRYHWYCGKEKDGSAHGSQVPFVILQATLRGSGVFVRESQTFSVPVGFAFICIPPEEAQYFYPPQGREPYACCWINFYGDLSVRLWTALRNAFGPVIPLSADSLAALSDLIYKVQKHKFEDWFQASQEAYAFYIRLWRQLARPPQGHEDALSKAIQYGLEHCQVPLSMKELAARANITREHFSRAFKQRQGVSPAVFYLKHRLQIARQLLQTTTLSAKAIAAYCGFRSARHFRLAYRHAYGCLPRPGALV